MKPYKFLIPVAIAAGALGGNAVKANGTTQPESRIEQAADSSVLIAAQSFSQKYTPKGEEHTLFLRVSDQETMFADHSSHSSHSSHVSHHSHRSGM